MKIFIKNRVTNNPLWCSVKQTTHKHSKDEVSSSVDTNGTVHDSLEKTHPNEEPSININILTRKILMCQISDIRAKIWVNSNYSLSPLWLGIWATWHPTHFKHWPHKSWSHLGLSFYPQTYAILLSNPNVAHFTCSLRFSFLVIM